LKVATASQSKELAVWGHRDVAAIRPSLGCHGVGRSILLCAEPDPDPLPEPQRNCASLLFGLWRRCSWWRPRWVRTCSRSIPFGTGAPPE